ADPRPGRSLRPGGALSRAHLVEDAEPDAAAAEKRRPSRLPRPHGSLAPAPDRAVLQSELSGRLRHTAPLTSRPGVAPTDGPTHRKFRVARGSGAPLPSCPLPWVGGPDAGSRPNPRPQAPHFSAGPPAAGVPG